MPKFRKRPVVVEAVQYLVLPGFIKSKSDGDEHYITAQRLMELYRVPTERCKIILPEHNFYYYRSHYPHAIVLRPRFDGNYNLAVDPQ